MDEGEVPVDPAFRKVLYDSSELGDTAIGPRFLEEYFPKTKPTISYSEIIPIFSEIFLQVTFFSIYLVDLLVTPRISSFC